MANTYLSRTPATVGNQKTFTTSVWVKRATGTVANGDFDSSNYILSYVAQSGSQHQEVLFGYLITGILSWGCNPSGSVWEPESNVQVNGTNVLFRDPSAWYHIVFAVDTTQATESNRLKCWVNGVQYSMSAYPAQNLDTGYNYTHIHNIGRYASGGTGYSSFLMSHFHQIDGTAYDASAFGEFDATTGIWKPKTAPSVTYGTNGFFLKFENSGSMGTDSSPNGNNFTVNGTMTQTVDTPSNVFATLNAVKKLTGTLSNGNTTWTGNGDNGVWSTIGNNSGKWYWETKNNANSIMCGIASEDVTQATSRSENTGVYGVQNGSTYAFYRNNGSSGQSSGFPDPTTSNIVCHALDLDNGKYFVGVDGVFKNLSGTTSNLGTGADPTFTGLDTAKFWFPFIECRSNSAGANINFGNGYFGTTPVSSAGSNGNGAIFEYDVPTGYYALNTKNINTYG
jgi:hypothetical protein